MPRSDRGPDRGRRFLGRPRPLDRELAVLLQDLAVDLDPAALAQVADEVGVHGAVVDTTGLGVAGPDGEVDGSADLLVEQDVPRAAVDPVVGADAELAQAPRPASVSSMSTRNSSPCSAVASITLPPSKRSFTPETSRPPTTAGR